MRHGRIYFWIRPQLLPFRLLAICEIVTTTSVLTLTWQGRSSGMGTILIAFLSSYPAIS